MTNKPAVIRMASACGLLIGGIVALQVLASALNFKFDKPPVPLRKELASIPKVLGSKYKASPQDWYMPADQLSELGTKEYLLRDYADIDNPRAGILRLNVNYYATGTGSVHVPEICWTESGLQRYVAGDREFEIKGVRLADGSTVDLPVRLLTFSPSSQDLARYPGWSSELEKHLTCVAYTFFVNGEYVGRREQVMQKFWKATYPFAIHAKIEVKVGEPCSVDQAQPMVEAFFREAMPEISACLPDTKELLSGRAAETQGSGTSTQTSTTSQGAMPGASSAASAHR